MTQSINRTNCLNTIRLLAAIQILYMHTSAHLKITMPYEIVDYIINFFDGVPIFFTLSGFLIWHSIGRSNTFGQYLKKRFWRIYPELWKAVLIELLVILILYKGTINWLQFGVFGITQATIFQFWTPDCLRGYGCGCPNGSLWTICVLIQFYFFAYYIYKLLHNKKSGVWIASIATAMAVSYFSPHLFSHLPEIAGKLYQQTLIPYLWMFLLSAFVAERADRILPLLKKYWYVFIAATIIINTTDFDIKASYYIGRTIALFLGLLGASYIFPRLNIQTDISYGIYIYHMTVVNALIALNYSGNIWLLIVVLTITCLLAYISTKTIGNYSQMLKKSL